MTTSAHADSSGRIREYMAHLSVQARSSLLTEIERLQLYGEDVSAFAPILAALRAEFRKGGEAGHRIGNPPRYFFRPLEVLFVDRPPEKANAGQISRGSLPAIWEWISHELLPAMTRDYSATMTKALVGCHSREADEIANVFQTKVVKSMQGALALPDGEKSAEHGLAQYTSSHASMAELKKILAALQIREALAALGEALPRKIDHFGGEILHRVLAVLDPFVAKFPQGLPFALTVLMRRLQLPWQIVFLATHTCHGKAAEDIARSRYAIAVSMVLDLLDEHHLLLKQALKMSRIGAAKETLREINEIEDRLHDRIDGFDASGWGRRLTEFAAELGAELEAEIHTLPAGTHHVLESLAHRRHGGLLHYLSKVGHDALAGGAACYERLIGADHRHAG